MDVYKAARASSLGWSLPEDDPVPVVLVSLDQELPEDEFGEEEPEELPEVLGGEEPPEIEFSSVHQTKRRKGPRPFLRLVHSSKPKPEDK